MRRLWLVVVLVSFGFVSANAQVKLTREADAISIDVNRKPFTSFIFRGEGVLKPYFHPVRSASGKIVSRRYPMEVVDGESHDHPHHRGLWFAHGDVNGIDFWTADPSLKGDHYGSIVLDKIVDTTSGADSGSFEATFLWKGPKGEDVLRETRRVTIHAQPADLRIMDFDIRLTAIKDAHFGDTKEGTFAIRVADEMNEEHTGTLVNAAGEKGEKNVWGRPSPYADYYGEVDGEELGIAIFDHPDNPKHPTYWHARAYGLFAANIFGEHDFFSDPSREGGLTLRAGQQWRFRYRVVIHPGDPASAGIDKMYAAYAAGR